MTAGWPELRGATPARIGLGRSGAALPTAALLDFQLAHARARDAVHAALDAAGIVAELSGLGLQALHLRSQAPDRPTYLRRPDLGRRLDEESRETLRCQAGEGGNPLGHRASKESVVPGLRRTTRQRKLPLAPRPSPSSSPTGCPRPRSTPMR
jgi:hypothetical protein